MGSLQWLSSRKVRLLANITGLDVIRAWCRGDHMYYFITADHEHYEYNIKTKEWNIKYPLDDVVSVHGSFCRELFPEDFD